MYKLIFTQTLIIILRDANLYFKFYSYSLFFLLTTTTYKRSSAASKLTNSLILRYKFCSTSCKKCVAKLPLVAEWWYGGLIVNPHGRQSTVGNENTWSSTSAPSVPSVGVFKHLFWKHGWYILWTKEENNCMVCY